MRHLLTLALFLACGLRLAAAEYAIPTARRPVSWEAGVVTGVVGGIPSRSGATVINVTDHGFSGSQTGDQNKNSVNAAILASSSGNVIQFPAGDYDCDGFSLVMPGITVRGHASGTTLRTQGWKIIFGGSTNLGSSFNPITTVTGLTRGSTTITVADGTMPNSFESAGGGSYNGARRMARLSLRNENATPIIAYTDNASAYTHVLNFPVILNGRSGNNLTLTQPMPSAFADALAAGAGILEHVVQAGGLLQDSGIEDITFISESGAPVQLIVMQHLDGCWLKNVTVSGSCNYVLSMTQTVNCEVRESSFTNSGGGTNTSGVLIDSTSYLLFEDNYAGGGPGIELFGSVCNSVFGYNHTGVLYANHAPVEAFNLYEGNSWWYWISDGFFGASIYDTLFRNFAQSGISASVKRFTRGFNYIGNLVKLDAGVATDYTERWGDPNIGNENSTGTAQPSVGDWWASWDTGTGLNKLWSFQLTTRTDDYNGVITIQNSGQADAFAAYIDDIEDFGSYQRRLAGFNNSFLAIGSRSGTTWTIQSNGSGQTGAALPALNTIANLAPNAGSWYEFDLDVAATAIKKANWYGVHGQIPAGESLGSDTIPASLYRTSAPSFMSGYSWPPYDSASPGTPSADYVNRIPAGYRFNNSGGGGTPPAAAYNPARLGPMGARRR